MRSGTTFLPSNRHDTYPAIDPRKADLSDKVILITGASKGVGKAIALAFAQSGARGLVLLARSSLAPVQEACLSMQRPGHPLQILTLHVDIANNDQVEAAAKQVEATFGRLDIVINNVGYLGGSDLIAESDTEEWWKGWEVNIRGTYHVTRAFVPLLIQAGGDKTIVNMSSSGALGIGAGYSSYCVSALSLCCLSCSSRSQHFSRLRSWRSCVLPNSSMLSTATRAFSRTPSIQALFTQTCHI